MKLITIVFLSLVTFCASSEPLSYYKQFFDRTNNVTHDPDFPEYEFVSAKNDLYQVAKTGPDNAVGAVLSFSLRENGTYSFWLLTIPHRWKNEQRQIRITKCQAFNGHWEHREGKLFLGEDLILEPTFLDGQNLLKPTFVKTKRPAGTENINITINDGSIDTIGGVAPDSPNNGIFKCGGFSLPFWIPIPNERPW